MTMFEYENGAELHAVKEKCCELNLPYIDDKDGNILVDTDRPADIYDIQAEIDGAVCNA